MPLTQSDCMEAFGHNLVEVDRRCHEASTSADPSHDLAKFVHWATDTVMDFLYQDPEHLADRARRAANTITPVRKRLQQHTRHVCTLVSVEREDFEYRLSLQMLHQFFGSINDHHQKVLNSDVGIEEILTVGKENDFIQRGPGSGENVQELYRMFVKHKLSTYSCVQSMGVVIENQPKEQNHPMPLEFALRTMAPAIPRLDLAVLQSLPLRDWLHWSKDIGLGQIGEEIAAAVRERLASLRVPQDPHTAWSPSYFQTAHTHHSDASVASSLPRPLLRSMFGDGLDSFPNTSDAESMHERDSHLNHEPLRSVTASTPTPERKARQSRSVRAESLRAPSRGVVTPKYAVSEPGHSPRSLSASITRPTTITHGDRQSSVQMNTALEVLVGSQFNDDSALKFDPAGGFESGAKQRDVASSGPESRKRNKMSTNELPRPMGRIAEGQTDTSSVQGGGNTGGDTPMANNDEEGDMLEESRFG